MKIFVVSASLAVLMATAVAQNQPSVTGSAAGGASVQAGQTSAGATAATSAQSVQNGQSAAGQAEASANAPGVSATTGATMEAELTKGIDAKKAKQGDPVIAKCTKEFKGSGNLRIPKNAKLIGHVTEVRARGKGQAQSTLAIAFDKAQLKDGREILFNATIQAIVAPPTVAMPMDNSTGASDSVSTPSSASRPNGGGALGGVNSTVNSATSAARAAGNTTGNVASTAGNVSSQAGAATTGSLGSSADTTLSSTTSGVVGLKGLQLDAASNTSQSSVIRSNSDNVRLESGTRLVLRLAAQ